MRQGKNLLKKKIHKKNSKKVNSKQQFPRKIGKQKNNTHTYPKIDFRGKKYRKGVQWRGYSNL